MKNIFFDFKSINKMSLPTKQLIGVYSIALISALIPFSFNPSWNIPFFHHAIPIHFLIFSAISLYLLVFNIKELSQHHIKTAFFSLSAILLGSLFLSSITTPESKTLALKSTIGFFLRGIVPGVTAYILSRRYLNKGSIPNFIILLGTLVSIYTLMEIAFGSFIFFNRDFTVRYGGDFFPPDSGVAAGPIGQPLPLAAFLFMALPFALFPPKKKNSYSYIFALLIFLTIFLTYRRSALLLSIGFAGIWLFKSGTKKQFLWGAGLFGLLFSIALGMGFKDPYIRNRLKPTIAIEQLTTGHRAWNLKVVFGIFKDHPVLGVGPRQYERVYKKYTDKWHTTDTPDNQYLRFLAEGGIIGLGSFLVFIYFTISNFWRKRHSNLGLAYLLSLGSFFIMLLLVDGLYWPALQSLFWLICGSGWEYLEELK